MTEQELDRAIRRLLIEVQKAEEPEDGADVPFVPSAHYRRSLRAMCRNPLKWAWERQRPVWKRLAQRAAMFLLVGSIGLAGLTAAVPSARAAVAAWAREVYEDRVVYRFSHLLTQENELPHYQITWLPGKYEVDVYQNEHTYSALYLNEDASEGFVFEYSFAHNGMALYMLVDEEEYICKNVTVNGNAACYYEALTSGETNNLVWIDESAGIVFQLNGMCEEAVILHIAESIILDDSTK